MKSESEVFDKVNEEFLGKNETSNTKWIILGIIAILFLLSILLCIDCRCRCRYRSTTIVDVNINLLE